MASQQHGGDLYNLDDMSDDEIRELVLEQLRASNIDVGWVEVQVKEGLVTIGGRLGTDMEIQVVDQVVQDLIGVERYSNELVVDELHRFEGPEGADEHVAMEADMDDQLGDPSQNQSDTAEHLQEDLGAQTYGTHDMGEAIQNGTAYIPPDRPIGNGYGSRENH